MLAQGTEDQRLVDGHHLLVEARSVSRAGNCYDNATMESFWATLKTELLQDRCFLTHDEARSALFSYIEIFYHRRRLHGALGYNSPVEYENNLG